MSATALKVVAHTALFLVAIVVFYLGLGVGLQVSPVGGMSYGPQPSPWSC